jgi:hypothetical protein
MLPPYRTALYAEYKAAERFGMLPPGIPSSKWDDLDWWQRSMLMSYDEIRTIEEVNEKTSMLPRL